MDVLRLLTEGLTDRENVLDMSLFFDGFLEFNVGVDTFRVAVAVQAFQEFVECKKIDTEVEIVHEGLFLIPDIDKSRIESR